MPVESLQINYCFAQSLCEVHQTVHSVPEQSPQFFSDSSPSLRPAVALPSRAPDSVLIVQGIHRTPAAYFDNLQKPHQGGSVYLSLSNQSPQNKHSLTAW